MSWWYYLVDLLPFEWAEPGKMLFMKNALLAIIIITPLFGILSTMIVNNGMAFFSDSLGHGAFTGIVVGALAGSIQPLWASIGFSVLFAILVTLVKRNSRLSGDSVIGVFSSISVALGIFLSTLGGRSFTKLNRYLIGDLLSITPEELMKVFLVFAASMILWIFLLNKLVVISVHPSLAMSRGIRVLWIEMLFAVLIAIVVTLSMSWVGLLVINALLVLPGSISRNVSRNVRAYMLVSVVAALITGVGGLLIAYYAGAVAGATIVLLLGVLFLGTFVIKERFD